MRALPDRSTFCRVTLHVPGRRVDVALPADVPLAELVPLVLELLGEPRPGRAAVAWRFSGATGGPLPPGATLAALGVLDGELLRLGPHAPPPPPPAFDDPADAVAATAGRGGAVGPHVLACVAVLAAVLAGGLVVTGAGAGTVPAVLAVLTVATGAVACLVRAAGAARACLAAPPPPGAAGDPAPPTVADGHALAAVASALAAVPLAGAAGWAAVPGPPGPGHVLVAAAVAGCVAGAGQIAVRVIAPALVGVVVVCGALLASALLRAWFAVPPAGLAAGVGTLALAVGPALPRLALALAGLPRPSVPTDARELVTDDRLHRLPAAELADRAELARGFLAGLVGGAATVAAAAAVVSATGKGWTAQAAAVVLLLVTGLRARGFADVAPARACLVAALAGAAGLAVVLAVDGGAPVRLVLAAAAGAAALGAAVLVGRTEPVASPVSRRALDLLEGALLAASIPLALAVAGVYGLVRGL